MKLLSKLFKWFRKTPKDGERYPNDRPDRISCTWDCRRCGWQVMLCIGEERTCANCGWVWLGVDDPENHNWKGKMVHKAKKTDPRYPNSPKPEPPKKVSHYEKWE